LEAASAGDPELASAFAQAGRPGATPTVRSLETIREDFFGGPRRIGGAAGQAGALPIGIGGALARFTEVARQAGDGQGRALGGAGRRRFERPEFTEEKARRRHNVQARRLGVAPEDLAISQAIAGGRDLTSAQQQRKESQLSPEAQRLRSEEKLGKLGIEEKRLERESIERENQFSVLSTIANNPNATPQQQRRAIEGMQQLSGVEFGDVGGGTDLTGDQIATALETAETAGTGRTGFKKLIKLDLIRNGVKPRYWHVGAQHAGPFDAEG
jgi:hypothetical protein